MSEASKWLDEWMWKNASTPEGVSPGVNREYTRAIEAFAAEADAKLTAAEKRIGELEARNDGHIQARTDLVEMGRLHAQEAQKLRAQLAEQQAEIERLKEWERKCFNEATRSVQLLGGSGDGGHLFDRIMALYGIARAYQLRKDEQKLRADLAEQKLAAVREKVDHWERENPVITLNTILDLVKG